MVLVILYSHLKLPEGQYNYAKHNITAKQYNSPLANITEAPSLRRVPLRRVLIFYLSITSITGEMILGGTGGISKKTLPSITKLE